MERADVYHAPSIIDAWKQAAATVASPGGAKYVTIVGCGNAWQGDAVQCRALDQAAQQIGAERPTAVAGMLVPGHVKISTENPAHAIESGLRMLGRGRRRGLRFSTWTHTYFERLVGVWYDRFGGRSVIKPNRLLAVISKLNEWDKNAEAVFYVHTDITSDNYRPRGSPCLQYVQFRAHGDKMLSIIALYRAHDYTNKFLGNALGLKRLGEFVARHTNRTLDGMTIVSLHPFCEKKQQLRNFINAVY